MQVKILQDYYDTMLYRDLIERFNITNIPALKYFIRRVFENITNPLSVHKIFNELKTQGYKIGKNLLYEFMKASSAIYLFILEKKHAQSILKEELGEKKAYVIDNGLLNAVTFRFSADYGKLLENLVFLEFQKKGYKTFFYKGKKECDFILYDDKGDKTAIQVCADISDADTRKREIEGLAEACKNLKIEKGYILTLSHEETITYEGLTIQVEPAFKFLLGLEASIFP
ncbi:MAG: ATP-binding protein [bacterium]